ncbi:MAG TPA: inosine/xanthosine triphosphatase [Candidatus Acidoferrales bacterium]|jgi:inosine/xanthosine triphosphatase|nr:inosine/xanthosine triphosphatase [Candidatus Acidoferrales bacterium]
METIIVAVGSKRAPKIGGVREALSAVGPLLQPEANFEVRGFEVETGVSHTPVSSAELMAGARGRCEALIRLGELEDERPRYFVGVEGGLDVVHDNGRRLAFLESWAFVADASGPGFYGRSGAILLPEPVAAEVLDHDVELSRAIEAYAGVQGVRDRQGAWGVLTRNLIDRQESFRIAAISAFAPFFNVELYQKR